MATAVKTNLLMTLRAFASNKQTETLASVIFIFYFFLFFLFLIIINNTREKNLTMVIAKSIVPIFWYKLKTRVSTHQQKGAYLKRSPKNGCKVFVTVFFTRKCPDVPYIPELLV